MREGVRAHPCVVRDEDVMRDRINRMTDGRMLFSFSRVRFLFRQSRSYFRSSSSTARRHGWQKNFTSGVQHRAFETKTEIAKIDTVRLFRKKVEVTKLFNARYKKRHVRTYFYPYLFFIFIFCILENVGRNTYGRTISLKKLLVPEEIRALNEARNVRRLSEQ